MTILSTTPVEDQRRRGNLLLLGGLLLFLAGKSVPLLLHTLLSPLAGSLGLRTLGVHLVLEGLLAGSLGLGLVDLGTLSVFMFVDDAA
jgi:hypothetical protein